MADGSTDVTGGKAQAFFDAITPYLVHYVIPSVLTLLVIVVALGKLLGWGQVAARSGGDLPWHTNSDGSWDYDYSSERF